MLTVFRETLIKVCQLAGTITAQDLDRPTPCQDWDLRDLLAHQLGELTGFTEAVSTGDAPPASFDPAVVDSDRLTAQWRRATSSLLDAATAADQDKIINLAGFGKLPVATVLRMQLLDTAVHGWDIASSIGRSYRPVDAVVTDVLGFARQIATRPEASTAFDASVAATEPAEAAPDDWATALQLLGRRTAPNAEWLR
ncbi:TIGR03086 family protein [Microlunatus elymi]|uniref:TIGR03086 family protein n=1 Tax=Microlunatus elymi TaxID=2596828 RepID=A0A516PX79_9ACTN|nr:TIGR03086 family metal-binding protein [Microlunatus elymi]QDP95784.1 TIGR03086 family protein [Microlunatus elymi]